MKMFPKNFMWGASVAAHQVDGGAHDQWTVWELAHASELAKTAKTRLDYLAKLAGMNKISNKNLIPASKPENYVSASGIEHYKRYEEDFNLLETLNLNAFRFSIDWSRIEPEEGVWDRAAIEHYRDYIKSLKKRNIEPVVTLWHWTVPVWFSEKGEFEKAENIKYFERFVKKIAKEYSDDLRYVITLNEPGVHILLSYILGTRPPQKKNYILAVKVMFNLVTAHKRAYKILKKENITLRVGVAYSISNIQPQDPHSLRHGASAKMAAYIGSWWYLDRIAKSQDFIGLNYYFTDYKNSNPTQIHTPKYPTNDLGWYMEPEGVYDVLMQVWRRYNKPIIVTENGLADSEDKWRKWWLEQTMHSLEKALAEGVDLRGYLHWSLLDNFEWDYGWWPQFGLVHVDRGAGMKRIIRPSAYWYADYIRQQIQKN
jgi:beta-glucosidase